MKNLDLGEDDIDSYHATQSEDVYKELRKWQHMNPKQVTCRDCFKKGES